MDYIPVRTHKEELSHSLFPKNLRRVRPVCLPGGGFFCLGIGKNLIYFRLKRAETAGALFCLQPPV
jgi:hypothetical protein